MCRGRLRPESAVDRTRVVSTVSQERRRDGHRVRRRARGGHATPLHVGRATRPRRGGTPGPGRRRGSRRRAMRSVGGRRRPVTASHSTTGPRAVDSLTFSTTP